MQPEKGINVCLYLPIPLFLWHYVKRIWFCPIFDEKTSRKPYFNFSQKEENYCTKMGLGPVFSNLVPEPFMLFTNRASLHKHSAWGSNQDVLQFFEKKKQLQQLHVTERNRICLKSILVIIIIIIIIIINQ